VRYEILLFDLDDTLYPHTSGLWAAIRIRMETYMHERLGLPKAEIPKLRQTYYETYGTTLRGLQYQQKIDTQDFLSYVHDVPITQFLQPNLALKNVLDSLPQKRYIFTNSDQPHALRVLSALGLTDSFDGIIDVNALAFIPKPETGAFQTALKITQANPNSTVFFDDSVRNLKSAAALGISTVLVGQNSSQSNHCSITHIEKLEDLPQTMPDLWDTQSAN
jgi:putative hydrolase of the HAD superfamily